MSRAGPGPSLEDLYGRAVRRLPEDPIEVSPCIACESTVASLRFAVEGVESPVVVCDACGLGRFHPMPRAEQIAAFYPDTYYGEPGRKFRPAAEGLVRWIGARHVSFLSRGLAAGARVLDVGCGRGVVLGALADRGLEVHGVERSAEAARGADSRAQVCIAPRLVDAGYPEASFDAVLCWHTLEHLAAPRETLEEAHRILRPGGRLIVAVPNFASAQARWSGPAWFHLDLPRHLYHFPLPALRRLLEATGFELRSEHHFSLRQNPFGWIQSALNLVAGLPRNGLYVLLQRRGGEAPPYTGPIRAFLRAGFALLAPFALAATLVESVARNGATVHVVARRRPGRPAAKPS